MNSFFYSLLILIISLEVLFAQNTTNQLNLCDNNNGNIQIKSAFRLESHLFFFGENGEKFKVKDFKWSDTNEFTYEGVEALDPQVWNATDMKITSTINHPTKGVRVLQIDKGIANNIDQLLAFLLEVEEKSGSIISKEEISINIYKCLSNPEPMNLCSLFAKFPQEEMVENFLSMASFPPSIGSSNGLPSRFFVYYREIPPEKRVKVCPGCYKTKRYLMVGKNSTYHKDLNETNWRLDNSTTNPCVNLNGVIVNASLALTDYIPNGQGFDFFLMEFSGTTYTISLVQISSELKVLENLQTRKSGLIGELFNCKQPPTTTPSLTTEEPPSDEPRLPSDGPHDGKSIAPEGMPTSTETSKSGGRFPIILIILIILLVVVIIGVIAWFLIRRGASPPPPPPPPAEPPSAPGLASTPGPTVDISEGGVTPTPSDTKTIRSDL